MSGTRTIHFLKRTGVLPQDVSAPRITVARHYWKYVVQFTAVFAAYFVAGRLGQATTDVRSNNLGPVWPAYGIALAAILLCGYRIWPAVALGVFVIAVLSPESYLTALGQMVGSTAAALIGTFLLRHIAKFNNSLSRLRDVFALVLLGAFASAIVSASIGTLVLHASNVNSYAGLGSAWLIYWLGDSTGVLLVTPVVLTFPTLLRIRNWARLAELFSLLTILVGISAIVFGDLAIIPVRMIAFAVLPLVIWAAFRFGVSAAALSILLVATVATVQTALGSGSFASSTPFINGLQLDVFFAVLSLTGLTFAAVYAERELAQHEREQSLREQVAMEVRLQNQELLRDSEQRFRLAAQAGNMYSFEWDVTTDVVVRSPERVKVLGGTEPTPITHQQFVETIYPDDRLKFIDTIARLTPENPIAEVTYRVRGSNGALVWLKSSGRAFFDQQGKMLRVVGMVADITHLKRADEALAEMTRKLIQAQEQERSRIGRELHDDINQRLAMVSVELETLQQSPSELQKRAPELRKDLRQISDDVQAISHDLHSSNLEYLGAIAGMKSWCKEVNDRHRIEVAFRSDFSGSLPLEIGLPIFRVLQEAVNNSIKHSGEKRVEVRLYQGSGEIHLMISDSGKGFDVESAMGGKGLGLISMRERVRLLNGRITIESKPMRGTNIHVRVPLKQQSIAE